MQTKRITGCYHKCEWLFLKVRFKYGRLTETLGAL